MSGVNGVEEIEATAVEIQTVPEVTALAPTGGAVVAVAPQIDPADLVSRLAAIEEAQVTAMTEGVDYGVVPGTSGKPSLFKPGAEKLSVLFQLDVQLVNELMWGPGEHLTVISRATVFHIPTGARLGYGEGMCSTRERKYRKRRRERSCPDCGEEAILKSRKDPEWFCWRKKGGCGATFALDDQRIVGQETGDKENPDLPDTWNTVLKMSEKRGRVDAVLAVTGASALFTQDVEDGPPVPDQEHAPESRSPQGGGAAPAQGPSLDPQRVVQIRKGINALGLDYTQVDLMLKAVGAGGLQGENNAAVVNAVKALSADQAEAVEGRLDAASHGRGAEGPQAAGAEPPPSSGKPLPASDLPEPDWDGLARGEGGNA